MDGARSTAALIRVLPGRSPAGAKSLRLLGRCRIVQIRATLIPIVEFDLKSLPVPVTAFTQHFHIAFAVNQ